MSSLSLDQLRLLHIVHRFTDGVGLDGKSRWMKDLQLSILVYHAIHEGVFDDYDWAPSLVECHGVKMYGKVSQEAHSDLKRLQSKKLLDKLHLSTCLYDTIRAYRATEGGREELRNLPEECRRGLEALLTCEDCSSLREVMAYVEHRNGHWGQARTRTVSYCPRCCRVSRGEDGPVIEVGEATSAKTVIDFFDIADIDYRSRPIQPRGLA